MTYMIVITSSYGLSDLKTDLQYMYKRAGEKDEGVMFLFTDNQIANEKFFVFFNDLLASGCLESQIKFSIIRWEKYKYVLYMI